MIFTRNRTILLTGPLLATLLVVGCGDGTTLTQCSSCGNGTNSLNKPSSTSLTVSPLTAVQGQNVTFTVSVNPSAAVGLVNLYDLTNSLNSGGGNLSAGTVALPIDVLAVGTHSIEAQYTGDTTYAVSASSPVTVAIAATGVTCGLGGAAYALTGGSASQTNVSFSAATANQSAVCATGVGTTLALTNPMIASAFVPVSRNDISGLGAAVLAYSTAMSAGGAINLVGGSVAATGTGIDAVFASGPGAAVNVSGSTLTSFENEGTNSNGTYLDSGHTVGVGRGGSVTLTNVTASNSQGSAALLAVDGDGSTMNVSGGTLVAGGGSVYPLYGEIARIEGNSALTLTNVTAKTTGPTAFLLTVPNNDGAAAGTASLTLNGGSVAVAGTSQPSVFFVQGTAAITLNGATIAPLPVTNGPPAEFLEAAQSATATLSATGQTIAGDLYCYNCTALTIALQAGSSWTGAASGYAAQGGTVSLTLDATSTWTLTGNSIAGTFNDAAGIVGTTVTNITGNGFNVMYDAAKSPALGGKTYQLAGGGVLEPGATN